MMKKATIILTVFIIGIIFLLSLPYAWEILTTIFNPKRVTLLSQLEIYKWVSAGAVIYKTHKTYVDELKGLGKSMPVVMWCFTIFGLTLVGIPPTSGFVSKWFLAMGSLNSGLNILSVVGPCVLLTSAFLTAGYLISVSINAFLPGNDFDYSSVKNTEPNMYMLVPLITLAIFAVVFGIYATPFEAFFTSIANILM